MGLLLGIESSSEYCTVLITENGEVKSMVQHTDSFSHAAVLTRLIESCLHKANAKMSDLEGIFLSIGPGSYTSLRVGVSTAKGIAFALNIPIVAIPTLKILALSAKKYNYMESAIYGGMIDARRMEVYIGFYDQEENEVGANYSLIFEADSFKSFQNKTLIFAGDGIQKAKDFYAENKNIVWTKKEIDWSVFARLGNDKFKSGDFSDLVNGEPIYLKQPNITIAKPMQSF